MRKSIIVLLCLYPSVLFAAEYPSFLNVEIGEPFSHPNALDNKDSERPTTQFNAPNHGPSSNLFHEYSVAYLNADNTVAIVTAERATESWSEKNTRVRSCFLPQCSSGWLGKRQDLTP